MKNKNIHFLTTCALMAALMCALCPLSVPIGPVPITLATLIVYLAVYILGWKGASISVLIYLLLGAVGAPVFSGYAGGLARLVGPTGGYLVGYIPLAILAGWITERGGRKIWAAVLGMLAGTAVLYLFGTVWFVIVSGNTFAVALSKCVTPFIPFDLVKIVVAVAFGKVVRAALVKARLLA